MPTFQVKYLVRAVIGIEVKGKKLTFDEAKAKASERMRKSLFADDIEVIDERDQYIGIDDMDGCNLD